MTFKPRSAESDMPIEQRDQFSGDTRVKINSVVVVVNQGQTSTMSSNSNPITCQEEIKQVSGKAISEGKPAGESILPEIEKEVAKDDGMFPEANVEINNIDVNLNQCKVHWQKETNGQDLLSSNNLLQGKLINEPNLSQREKDPIKKDEELSEPSVEVKLINANINQYPVYEWQGESNSQDLLISSNLLEGNLIDEPGLTQKGKEPAIKDTPLPEPSVEVKPINANVDQYSVSNWQEKSNGLDACCSHKDFLPGKYTGEPSLSEKEKDLELKADYFPEASVEVNLINSNIIQCPLQERQRISNSQDSNRRELQKQDTDNLSIKEKENNADSKSKKRQRASIKINQICMNVSQNPGRLYQEMFASPTRYKKETYKQLGQNAMDKVLSYENGLISDNEILEQANTGDDLIIKVGDSRLTQPVFKQVPGSENITGHEESNPSNLISLTKKVSDKESGKDVAEEEKTNIESIGHLGIGSISKNMDRDTIKIIVDLINTVREHSCNP